MGGEHRFYGWGTEQAHTHVLSEITDLLSGLGDLTAGELEQLTKIDTTVISAQQWEYLGELDQNLKAASSPQFVRVTLSQTTGTAPLVIASSTAVENLNADLLDGSHASAFAAAAHVHDDRYYTEDEMDAALATKSDVGHSHNDLYYTEVETDILLATKSNVGHTHDDRYYTEGESDALLSAHAALLSGVHGLVITAGKTITVGDNAFINSDLRTNANWATSGSITGGSFITGSNIGIAAHLDLIQLTAANTVKVNGSVGIGTAPSYPLHVTSAANSLLAYFKGTYVGSGTGIALFGEATTAHEAANTAIYGEASNGTANYCFYGAAGDAWFAADVSALTFTDRSPYFGGDALALLRGIRGIGQDEWKEVDHESLPEAVRRTSIEIIDREKEITREVSGRDLGRMMTMNSRGIVQLCERIEALEAEVAILKAERN